MKNPGIAALLSFIIPGSGLVYCERIWNGIFHFLIWIALMIFDIRSIVAGESIRIFIFPILWWIVGIYGSYNTARKINKEVNDTSN